MIHYHGTPITPRSELYKMAGKCFCVSFADARDGDWCLQNAQTVMWDNGRFTQFTQGHDVDDAKLYAWLEQRLGHPHWAVVPDKIGGGIEDNINLIKQWPFRKELGAVVWHLDEPVEHLLALIEMGFAKICFGSAGAYWQVGAENWSRRIEQAFNAIIRTFGLMPWVHMLRGLSLCGDVYPFASADSTNVARNFKNKGSEVCPERMARRIDAVQCPITWAPRKISTQRSMFDDVA